MRVGFIGLGSQGAPMARAIIDAGFETTLWARRAVSLEPYLETTAHFADAPADLAAASDMACLCVVSEADIEELAVGDRGLLAGLAPGAVIVVHATVHPDSCRRLADMAATCGVSVVDAPVGGGGSAAQQKRLLVMVGGEGADVQACRPVFETYGDPIVHLGPLGAGQVTKILNNLLLSANLGTAMSLLDLSEGLGVSRSRMCEVITRGSASSIALQSLAAFGGKTAELAPLAGALLQKDVQLAADLAGSPNSPGSVVLQAADTALDAMGHRRPGVFPTR
ncbi:NAD(P)-dependent oxidoreductase [soil metagenome]